MKKILIALLALVAITMMVRCYNDDAADEGIVIKKIICPLPEIDFSQEIGTNQPLNR